MVCPHCGSETADGSVICEACGSAIGARKTPPRPEGLDDLLSAPTPVEPAAQAPVPEATAETVPVVAPAPVEPAPVTPVAPAMPVEPVDQTQVMPTPVEPERIPQAVGAPAPAPMAVPADAPEAPAQAAYVPEAPAQATYVPAAVPEASPQAAYVPSELSTGAAAQVPQKSGGFGKILLALAVVAALAVAVFGLGQITGLIGGRPSGSSTSANVEGYATDLADMAGNPTAKAFLTLDGAELIDQLESFGFEWSDEYTSYVSADGNNGLLIGGEDFEKDLQPDQISALNINGAGDVAVYYLLVDSDRYDSAEDAYLQLTAGVVEKEVAYESDLVIAILKAGGTRRNLAVFVPNDGESGLHGLYVFNEESVSAGMVDEYFGETVGTTIDDAFDYLTAD